MFVVLLKERPRNPSEHARDGKAMDVSSKRDGACASEITYSASLCPYKDDGSNMTGSPVVVSVPVFPLCTSHRRERFNVRDSGKYCTHKSPCNNTGLI